MHVDDFHVPFSRPRIHSLKNEFMSSRYLQQRQILGGRSDEDQIVVPDVIQREECSTLYAKLPVEEAENPVQLVDCQDLAHAGVMIEDTFTRIRGRVEIPHVGLRTSYKVGVAEDYPRRLLRGNKAAPKYLVHSRHRLFGRSLLSRSPGP